MMRAILLALALSGGVALGQVPSPPSTAPVAKAPATISVSELERVKVENLSLKIDALEKEINAFVTQFEAAHPGWSVNVKTQQVYQKPVEEPATPAPKK